MPVAYKKRKKSAPGIGIYANINWEKAVVLFQRPLPNTSESRLVPFAKDALRVLAAVGTIGFIFAFPSSAKIFAPVAFGNRSYARWGINKTLSQLAHQKFVTIQENEDGSITVRITKSGLVRALTYELVQLQIQKPKRWDGKWRVVIFDIPEMYKDLRNMFRMRLRQLGLTLLQESVFVSPYPCFDEVEFLRELYGVAFNVRYLLVEKIEDDGLLRQHFELST